MPTEQSIKAPLILDASSRLPSSLFRRACRELELSSYLEQALLVSEHDMVVGEWGADTSIVTLAAEHVRRKCKASTPAVQIQYVHLGSQAEAFLLYVKPMDGFWLTLVSRNDMALKDLRHVTNILAEILSEGEDSEIAAKREFLASFMKGSVRKEQATYAIAWRPVEPLPQAVRRIIRDSAERLARRKGCRLSFVGVASDHVHLVLECPPRRKGSWAAYVFKTGIEEDIAERYGTAASLWQKGFLADSSAEPFGAEAILAYLNY